MDSSRFLEGYDDVDGRPDPGARIAYLDQISTSAAYKAQTFAMLDPKPGECLLDVGCGTGGDARELARRVSPGGRVVGLDRSLRMLAAARQRSRSETVALDFCQGDALALEFADRTFDAARCDRTLQHLDRPADALAEMARVVRPGGRVVASEPDWGTLVLDAPGLDPDLSRRVVLHNGDLIRRGHCGRELFRLFATVGLAERRVRPMSVVLTDFTTADGLCRLSEAIDRLVAADEIAAERGRAWLEQQREASLQGLFFAAMTGFCVRGTKR